MRLKTRWIGFVVCVGFLSVPHVYAQQASSPLVVTSERMTGTWEGAMHPPSGQEIPIKYEIDVIDGGLSITLVSPWMRHTTRDVALDGDTIRFNWEASGTPLKCELKRADVFKDDFEGECLDPGNVAGKMTMKREAETAASNAPGGRP